MLTPMPTPTTGDEEDDIKDDPQKLPEDAVHIVMLRTGSAWLRVWLSSVWRALGAGEAKR